MAVMSQKTTRTAIRTSYTERSEGEDPPRIREGDPPLFPAQPDPTHPYPRGEAVGGERAGVGVELGWVSCGWAQERGVEGVRWGTGWGRIGGGKGLLRVE